MRVLLDTGVVFAAGSSLLTISSVPTTAFVGEQITISGACTSGSTVVVTVGGESFGSTSDTLGGVWSITATCPDVEGDNVAVVATSGLLSEESLIGYVYLVQTEAWIAGLGEDTTNGATVGAVIDLSETNVLTQLDGDIEADGVGSLARLLFDTTTGLLDANFSISYYAEDGAVPWVFPRIDNSGVYFNASTGAFGSDTSSGLVTSMQANQNGLGWDVEMEYSGIPSSGILRIFMAATDAGAQSPVVTADTGDTLANLQDLVVTQLRVQTWTGQVNAAAATQATVDDMLAVGIDSYPYLRGDGDDARLVNTTLGPAYGDGVSEFFAYVVYESTVEDSQGLFSFGPENVLAEITLYIKADNTLRVQFNNNTESIETASSTGSHIAIVQVTGGNGYLYLDGDSGSSVALSGPIDLSAFDLIIGNSRLTNLGFFGKIREIGFGTTLTATQRARLFSAMAFKWGIFL